MLYDLQVAISIAGKCVDQALEFLTECLNTIGLPLTPRLAEYMRLVSSIPLFVAWYFLLLSLFSSRIISLTAYHAILCNILRLKGTDAEIAMDLQDRWDHIIFDWRDAPVENKEVLIISNLSIEIQTIPSHDSE